MDGRQNNLYHFLFLALTEQVQLSKIQLDEQTEMLMKKSEQNQVLETRTLSMASEIDNLNEVIKMMSQELSQKIDEFHALGKKSKKEHDELEAQLSSNSEDFSARIENLQSELQEKSDQCTTFSQENTNLKSRITELEEVEVEKQKLIKNLAALKNKAKVCNIFYYRISNV